MSRIGIEDFQQVRFSGPFTDEQMALFKKLSEFSEYLDVVVDEKNKEACLTRGQKFARDLYESKVTKPVRTAIEGLFKKDELLFENDEEYKKKSD